ncbi:MAG: glutamine synthetase type III, partial [Peptococcaceae bacterium]|nr:glutamine synthetase type III [Peptococcaceae bacterium]
IMLNSAVAESLKIYADKLEKTQDFETALHEIIQTTIKDHKRIIFNGNGYDESWIKEATEKRGLLNYRTTADCMPHLLDKKNMEMLTAHGVFTEAELKSRYEIMLENYCKTIIIEANTMVDMARSQIAPAIESYAADVAKAASAKKTLDSTIVCNYETTLVKKLSHLVERIVSKVAEIEKIMISLDDAENIGVKSTMIRDFVLPLMSELRVACDEAETLTAKKYWPFPSYAELLFSVK